MRRGCARRIKYCGAEHGTDYDLQRGLVPGLRRVKNFLNERGVEFHEVDIDEDEESEELVLRVNNGRRKVPR